MMVLLKVLDKEESMVWFSDCFQFLQIRALLSIRYIFLQHFKVLLLL